MSHHGDFHHPIHELHQKRWSPRAFSQKKIEMEKLLKVLEAARWAPSSFNEQPWSFLVGFKEDAQEFQKFLECLVEGNRVWAKDAPVLMLSVAAMNFKKNDKPNRHAFHDVGLAAGSLVTEATHLGLYVHQMAGFDVERARENFEIPVGFDPVAMIAIGYLGDPNNLPEKLQAIEQAPRSRKSLGEFIFTGAWQKSASWIPAKK